MMDKIEFTTKVGCSVKCNYCPQKKFIDSYMSRSDVESLSLDNFKHFLSKIPKDIELIFSGMCEPWDNPDCTEMILYAHEQGYRIGVYTTLMGVGLEDIDKIESIPFTMFIIHLPDKDLIDGIVIDEKYKKVLDRLGGSGINERYMNFTGFVHPEIKPILKDKQVEDWIFYDRCGNLDISDVPETVKKKDAIRCDRGLGYPVILPNADVVLCSMDFGLKHVLGNILESDYDSILKDQEYTRVKDGLKKMDSDIICRYCYFGVPDQNMLEKYVSKTTDLIHAFFK